MRKILLVLLSGACALSFASSLDMSTLKCNNNYQVTTATTLADIQSNCTIKSVSKSKVKFTNNTTGKTVTCKLGASGVISTCK